MVYKTLLGKLRKNLENPNANSVLLRELRGNADRERGKSKAATLLSELLRKEELRGPSEVSNDLFFVIQELCAATDDETKEATAASEWMEYMGSQRSLVNFASFNQKAREAVSSLKNIRSISAQPIGGITAALTVTYQDNKMAAQASMEELEEILSCISDMTVRLSTPKKNGVRVYVDGEFSPAVQSFKLKKGHELGDVFDVVEAMTAAGIPVNEEELREEIISSLDVSTISVEIDINELTRMLKLVDGLPDNVKLYVKDGELCIAGPGSNRVTVENWVMHYLGKKATMGTSGDTTRISPPPPAFIEKELATALSNPVEMLRTLLKRKK